ncbi:methylcobamide--CoM methyltransferase [candidate division KSB1 bacterium]|nr:methylcobamide--CoM methyltransferase [candidate division KSB1 bacterium]
MNNLYLPLSRHEMKRAIERNCPPRIPLALAKFWGEGFVKSHGKQLNAFDRYPDDVEMLWIQPLDVDKMNLSWPVRKGGARDSASVIRDWSQLDEFIDKFPDPETDRQIDALMQQAGKAQQQDRYTLFCWWRFFFERPWALRGMENLLTDYYLYPRQVHKLHDALCNLYCGYIERVAKTLKPDAFFTSDDLGHQSQPMLSHDLFEEFLYPYYRRVGEVLQRHGLHWWLHSCGNNTPLLPDLIRAGVDVFHPVQKHTMDYEFVAREFGRDIVFLVGIDVQNLLPSGSPQQVREEVERIIDIFDAPDGGCCIGAGNGILPDTPLENIHAYLQHVLDYGSDHRKRFK